MGQPQAESRGPSVSSCQVPSLPVMEIVSRTSGGPWTLPGSPRKLLGRFQPPPA